MSSLRSAANALAQCVCQIHDRNGERNRAPAWSRSHAVAPTASRRSASSTFTGKPSEVFGRARGVQGFGRPLGGARRAPRVALRERLVHGGLEVVAEVVAELLSHLLHEGGALPGVGPPGALCAPTERYERHHGRS